jgi:DNA replication and repair protein RecF
LPVLIERLQARDFRIIEGVEIAPSPGVNIVAGPNAQGKTSLLEAIHLVSTGRLLRAGRDGAAIRTEAEGFRVSAVLAPGGTEAAVELVRGGRKRALLNGVALPRASDLLGRLPSVSFSAVDLSIVRGDPSERRAFMDEELAQLLPSYLRDLASYKRSLEQRNALLKTARESFVDPTLFEAWEERLGASGGAMRRTRRQWIEELAPLAGRAHEDLGSGETLALEVVENDEGASLARFAETRREDIARGATQLGPHRDDLRVTIGGMDARLHASQGQQRTAVIALKLGVLESARSRFGFAPVLLLDDVFSDLDSGRRSRLVERAMAEAGQVFLTCTEAAQAGDELVRQARVFMVDSGRVTEA